MDITGDNQDNVLGDTAGNDTIDGLGGDDTITFSSGVDVIKGGEGNDRIVLDGFAGASSFDGGAGIDTLVIRPVPSAPLQSLTNATVNSIERVEFGSTAGGRAGLQVLFGNGWSKPQQIGNGISATAELVGGAGTDTLILAAASGPDTAPYVLTAPLFTYTNWSTPDRAYRAGDRVVVSYLGQFNGTINGSAHAGVQSLAGGSGNDVINGSDGMDYISGGISAGNPYSNGIDQLYGGGGDDTLALVNAAVYVRQQDGTLVQQGNETTYTGGGSLFDGGDGFDFLLFGGNVDFQGTIRNIEGVYLSPDATGTAVAGPPTLLSGATRVTVSGEALAQFPATLEIDGVGTIAIDLADEDEDGNPIPHDFDGSDLTFTAGSHVKFEISGGDGAEKIVGTAVADAIAAGAGDDRITGGKGDDAINGGIGADIAYFADVFADCTITFEGDVTVVTTKTEGVDRLRNVEKLNFAGIDSNVVPPVDNVVPTVVIVDNGPATAIAPYTLSLTFSEDVNDLAVFDFSVSEGIVSQVTGSGKSWTATVQPRQDFEGSMTVTLNAAAVFDAAGNPNAAVTLPAKAIDTYAPRLAGAAPNNVDNARVDADIVVTFSEAIKRGTGMITIANGANEVVETFDAATSPRLSISGATLTIDPTADFAHETIYRVTMDFGGIRDLAGNGRGISPYEINFKTAPILPSLLFASPGFVGSVRGEGVVTGTKPGFQDITVLEGPGTITFDGSFNGGGDVIRLTKPAAQYGVSRSGSLARIFDQDSEILIPVGSAGTAIVFADGVRQLIAGAGNSITIGGQTILDGNNILAPADGTSIPSSPQPSAQALLYLAEDTDFSAGGNMTINGTNRVERIEVLGGDVVLDGTFNRGGDVLALDAAANTFTAQLQGSRVLLSGGGTTVSIPLGAAGMTIDFDGDQRTILFANGNAVIDDQVITSNSVTLG